MIRVLHIQIGEHFGGIEQLELEYAKHLNNNKIHIDVLAPNKKNYKYFEKKLNKYGSNLYSMDICKMTRKNELIYDYRLYKFLKKNKYDIIHINSEIFFFSFRVALIARLCGIKKIITHSHNSIKPNIIKRSLITILNPLYRSIMTEYLSCSNQAKKSLFTNNFINKNKIIILKNGIDINQYKFNEKIRKKYRNELNITDKIVYGHIGRFVKQKNHNFLIDLFYEIQKRQKNSILLLLGDGPLKNVIEKKVKELNISDKVIFLGFRDDANYIFNAMDVFLFPSLHEGLGIAALEAQTNGLYTFCSTKLPQEVMISNKFKSFDLNDNMDSIVNEICSIKRTDNDRGMAYKNAIKNDYCIDDVCKKLEKIYLQIMQK